MQNLFNEVFLRIIMKIIALMLLNRNRSLRAHVKIEFEQIRSCFIIEFSRSTGDNQL